MYTCYDILVWEKDTIHIFSLYILDIIIITCRNYLHSLIVTSSCENCRQAHTFSLQGVLACFLNKTFVYVYISIHLVPVLVYMFCYLNSQPLFLLYSATPEKPQNVTAVELTTTNVYLTWVEPHDSNAPIHGYRVSYIIPSFLGGTDITVNSTIEAVNITGLHPGAGYIFSVVAFNDIGDSARGSVMVTTVETGMRFLHQPVS